MAEEAGNRAQLGNSQSHQDRRVEGGSEDPPGDPDNEKELPQVQGRLAGESRSDPRRLRQNPVTET